MGRTVKALTQAVKGKMEKKNVINGGAFFTNFKLLDQCGEDVCVLVERLFGLRYSLKTVIEILNKPHEKKSDVVL